MEFIKNPVIAEFLGMQTNTSYYESELEQCIIDNLQKFLMELGKGYAFVARQQHIHTEKEDYFIDLVFYNYILPRFENLMFYNTQLLDELDGDQDRMHYYKPAKISELFEADKAALLPLPSVFFDTSRLVTGLKTDGYGRFTLDNGKHEYSSAPKYALGTVNVRLSASFITVLDDNYREIAIHRRLYGDEHQSSMEWIPYLEYISRHPRSLKNTGIYDMMPQSMQSYLNNCTGSEKKDVLHVLCELTERTGFDSAIHTVDQAIQYEAHDPDSLKSLYNSLYSEVPQLPPLTDHNEVPEVISMPVHLEDYDRFLRRGGGLNV